MGQGTQTPSPASIGILASKIAELADCTSRRVGSYAPPCFGEPHGDNVAPSLGGG